jgi:hypothetical protein
MHPLGAPVYLGIKCHKTCEKAISFLDFSEKKLLLSRISHDTSKNLWRM